MGSRSHVTPLHIATVLLTYMLLTQPTPPEVLGNYANRYQIETSSCILKCAYKLGIYEEEEEGKKKNFHPHPAKEKNASRHQFANETHLSCVKLKTAYNKVPPSRKHSLFYCTNM